ncbi:mitochondrial import inner membrane translocase subunit tim-16 [Kalaharituber pfeilii]|nr:mitochondrial import inner membrane translocase subunit tim-16 [Kalaharituber pfeilii]
MAHRIITQVLLIGSRAIGRAFVEAYRQHSAAAKYAAASSSQTSSSRTTPMSLPSNSITLDEACRILNVKPPHNGETNMEDVMERFKRLFDQNDPKKGGSFYLQSKVFRARERIEDWVKEQEARKLREKEVDEGWKPKVYKDR